MSRIVLGYDGSPAAKVALDWVAMRAARDDSRVELVTVTHSVTSDYDRTETDLDTAEHAVRDLSPDSVVTSFRRDGSMPSALIDEAGQADLLVIGVHRNRPVRNLLKGRMPARLSASARGPVCLVPDTWTASDGPVTVGVDDDPSSDEALMFAAREAVAAGVRLRIVHSWTMPTPAFEGSVALLASPLEVKETHRRILKDAVTRVQHAFPELEPEEQLVPEYPAGALLEVASDSSLLVIGTHHRGPFTAALLGSVGAELIGHVDYPICVVPSGAAR